MAFLFGLLVLLFKEGKKTWCFALTFALLQKLEVILAAKA